MIIVSSLNYDVVTLKWLTRNKAASIETEREKIIEEYGEPYEESVNDKGNLNMKYDSYRSVLIVKA